jgi:hypothetical protein
MPAYTGSINKLVAGNKVVGSYPVLSADFVISANGLNLESLTTWYAYLVALDAVSGSQVADMWVASFTKLAGPWPEPDIRTVMDALIELLVPLPAGGMQVDVQLYGSTDPTGPETFIQQRELVMNPGGPNYTPYLIAGGALLLGLAFMGPGKDR